jgi:exonuclease III
MTGNTSYLSILTLNVNRLNSYIKRRNLANWIIKEDPRICCLQETHLIDRNKHWLRVKSWKKIYQNNGPPKQAGVGIYILDKVDFKHTLIKLDKEGHSILIKGEIHQKEMTGITTYLSILTLNVNRLNSPIKRYHLANWIKKEDPTICCLQETHFIDRNKHWLRVKS